MKWIGYGLQGVGGMMAVTGLGVFAWASWSSTPPPAVPPRRRPSSCRRPASSRSSAAGCEPGIAKLVILTGATV